MTSIDFGRVLRAAQALSNIRIANEDASDTIIRDMALVDDGLLDDPDVVLLLQADACAAGIVTYARAREVEGGLLYALRAWPCYAEWVGYAIERGRAIPDDLRSAFDELMFPREADAGPRPVPRDDIDYEAVAESVYAAEESVSRLWLGGRSKEDRARAKALLPKLAAADANVEALIRADACRCGILTYAYARTVEGGIMHALRTWPLHVEWLLEHIELQGLGVAAEALPEDLECAVRSFMYAPKRPQEAANERC
jgi:hypothetical protein